MYRLKIVALHGAEWGINCGYSNSRLWPWGGGTNIWRKDALLFSSTMSARFWCHLFLFWSLPFLLVVYSMSFPLLLLSFNCHCSCNLFLFWCLTWRCRHCFLLLRYLQSQDLNEALKGCIYPANVYTRLPTISGKHYTLYYLISQCV